ncbi:class I SAM-dependent methyltransferase [Kaarinaea lacus]
MSKKTLNLNDTLYTYLLDTSLRDNPVQNALREETDKLEWARMQISPDQGQFLGLLVKLVNARRAIEVGTFTGYSALVVAQALPEDGVVVACDISEKWTNIGKRYWQQAGVAHKIDLRLAPAAETLSYLVDDGQSGSYDFAFIDADKENQLHYYELCIQLIRPGGLIAIDNVLWGGDVANPANQKAETVAIREFNQFVHRDGRVDISMVPIGDGLTLARKKNLR